MADSHYKRRGITMVEVLVVIAIIAVLIGLLLGAIQSARLSAARAAGMNDARQLLLATHNFANDNQGRLPNVDGEQPKPGLSVIRALCPYMEADSDNPPPFIRLRSDPSRNTPAPLGTSPIPPAWPPSTVSHPEPAECSFAFNPLVYAVGAKLATSISDGHSSTICLTEHYGNCGPTEFFWRSPGSVCLETSGKQSKRVPCVASPSHRATFADGPMYDDVVPVTTNSGGIAVTVGSLPLTFQVRPPLNKCDPRIPQSSLPGGILAGFADGSVRFFRPGIAPAVFWGSVTPDRGESVIIE